MIGTTFQIDANNIQPLPNGVFSILLISSEIPGGIPLDGLLLTACTAYVALPELESFFNLTLGNPTTSFPVPIPLDNAFVGVSLMSQAISDDLTTNAFGYRVSNGPRWNIGIRATARVVSRPRTARVTARRRPGQFAVGDAVGAVVAEPRARGAARLSS